MGIRIPTMACPAVITMSTMIYPRCASLPSARRKGARRGYRVPLVERFWDTATLGGFVHAQSNRDWRIGWGLKQTRNRPTTRGGNDTRRDRGRPVFGARGRGYARVRRLRTAA